MNDQQAKSKVKRYMSTPAALAWFACVSLMGLFVVACNVSTTSTNYCDSGICIDDKFIPFYAENDGDVIFGDPLTRLIEVETNDGRRQIQYFYGGLLEYDPDLDQVMVADLGIWGMAGRDIDQYEPAEVPSATTDSLYFPETDQTVVGAFLEFYEVYNGELLFGPPISPQIYEGDRIVQYFENVQLEWHPEAEQKVQVGWLGQAQYLYEVYEPSGGAAIPGEPYPEAAIVSAAVSAPIFYYSADDEQVIYVSVQTFDRLPVPDGVTIELIIEGQSGSQRLPGSTLKGSIQGELILDDIEPGRDVNVDVIARADGRELGRTTITFQTWW